MKRVGQHVWRGCALVLFLVATAGLTSHAPAQDTEPDSAGDRPTISDGQQLLQQQKWAEAAEVFRAITQSEPEDGTAWHLLGYALHAQGKLYEALPCHLMAAEFPAGGATSMYNVACVYALQKKTDKAFQWLNKARAAGFVNPQQLRTDPDMDNIRDDPRFEAILETMTIRAPGSGLNATPFVDEQGTPMNASRAPERQLDFWVGEWDVFTPGGQKAGTNRIEKSLNDNLILEHWTGAAGGEGKSVNYYDRATKEWVQVWVDGSGGAIVKRGGFKDGAMRMRGTHTLPTGEVRHFRSTLTPIGDGRVRQFIEESPDEGKTWSTWFEGTYIPTSG